MSPSSQGTDDTLHQGQVLQAALDWERPFSSIEGQQNATQTFSQ